MRDGMLNISKAGLLEESADDVDVSIHSTMAMSLKVAGNSTNCYYIIASVIVLYFFDVPEDVSDRVPFIEVNSGSTELINKDLCYKIASSKPTVEDTRRDLVCFGLTNGSLEISELN